MVESTSGPLLIAVDAYVEAPMGDNREKLIDAADEYREAWILAQASAAGAVRTKAKNRMPTTTYDRQLEVMRVIDGIPVKLALQERTSASVEKREPCFLPRMGSAPSRLIRHARRSSNGPVAPPRC